MTTTPTFWGAQTVVNTDSTGFQGQQKIIGLSNGNILVVFADDSGAVGGGAGRDIVGVIYGPTGNIIITPAFQLNTNRAVDDEEMPSIAATNDGGFVMAYEDRDSNGQSLYMERYNAAGSRTDSAVIQNDPGVPYVSNPSLTVDQTDNSIFVSYQWSDGADDSIRGKAFDSGLNVAAGTPADGHILRTDENTTSFTEGPFSPESVTLSNGNYATVHTEYDSDQGIEVRLSNGTTGANSGSINIGTTGGNGVRDYDPQIAALTGGGYVLVWVEDDAAADNIMFAVYSNTNTTVVAPTAVVDTGNNYNSPDVIGLKDGGFFVVSRDSTDNRLEGTRFNAAGAQIGTNMFELEDFNTPQSPELSLTSDGRILLAWTDASGDVRKEIWDPRDDVIVSDGTEQVIVARITDDTDITGSSASEAIYGQQGDDTIRGLGGDDTLAGGFGNNTVDYSYSAPPPPPMVALISTHTIDLAAGVAFLSTLFSTSDQDELNNFQNVIGSGWRDIITGNGANNLLEGRDGYDTIEGGGGSDTLEGGDGNDVLRGGFGTDTVDGGIGDDLIEILDGENIDEVNGGSGTDTVDMSTEDSNAVNLTSLSGIGTYTGLGGTRDITSIEVFRGTLTHDTLNAGSAGGVTIEGGGGDDLITGGANFQELSGGLGNDTIDGGFAVGSSVGDRIFGNAGDDSITGANGHDTIDGGSDNDTIVASGGNDGVHGGSGNDLLFGDGGNDTLFGGTGEDTIRGGDNDDIINGGGGFDDLYGDAGNDIFDFDVGDGYAGAAVPDRVDGGTGFDSLRLIGGNGTVDLSDGGLDFTDIQGLVFGGGGQAIVLSSGEMDASHEISSALQVTGGSGKDRIDIMMNTSSLDISGWTFTNWNNTADEEVVRVQGDSSSEAITGSSSKDVIRGDAGNDVLIGGAGEDTIEGGTGDDRTEGGLDNDVYKYRFASDGDDTIADGGGTDLLDVTDSSLSTLSFRRSGNNLIIEKDGTTGKMQIIDQYGAATSRVEGLKTLDTTISLKTNLTGTGLNELFVGTSAGQTIDAKGGDDLIFGSGGNDTVIGGSGDDRVFGGTGSDVYQFSFAASDEDFISEGGGGGTDTLMITDRAADELTFRRSGSVLVIEEEGGSGKIIIDDHYSGIPTERIELFDATDGTYYLKNTNIGTSTDDIIVGATANDVINGAGGRDLIFGGGGSDTIDGGTGADVITGGAAKDALTGGSSADVFVFNAVSDSTAAAAGRDTINDFVAGTDRMDLSAIDAITGGADSAFTFTGAGATSGAGTLAYSFAGGNTLVQADVDGGGADFSVLLSGSVSLTASDFIL